MRTIPALPRLPPTSRGHGAIALSIRADTSIGRSPEDFAKDVAAWAYCPRPIALSCSAVRREKMPEQPPVLTPSQLNTLARDLLESAFPLVWVEGELGNVTRPGSGHL